jgi:hypothetical protein
VVHSAVGGRERESMHELPIVLAEAGEVGDAGIFGMCGCVAVSVRVAR